MKICVFGGSRDGDDPGFSRLGEALGAALARRGHSLIFGGGGWGMMGAAARGCASLQGEIIGLTPRFFSAPGLLFEHCTELIRMDTMAERKSMMEEMSDGFIALPGGIGTLEEVYEVITLRSLRRLDKPIAFLDCDGYWLPALESLKNCVRRGFAGEGFLGLFGYFTDPEECLDYMEKGCERRDL